MKESLKKYLVEFIGTFFLVFTVGCVSLLGGNGVIPAIAIGFMLMAMVYAGGHISGGHYNPAVSLAAAMRGVLHWKHIAPYWLCQFLGATLAAFLSRYIGSVPDGVDGVSFEVLSLIIAEFLFTFALCYVVLLTATSERTDGNSYFGLAIGSVVVVGAFSVGGILCAGAFNPAVALGDFIMGLFSFKIIAITIAVNLIAGAIAALIYKTVELPD